MSISFFAKPDNLQGELPPEEPGGTTEWVSIFDNTVWDNDDIYSGADATVLWDSELSRFSVEEKVGGDRIRLVPIGTWYVDFRPDKVRVTLSDGTLGLVANYKDTDLNIGNIVNDTTDSAGNTVHTSANLQGDTNDDITYLYLAVDTNTTTGIYYITNIEFEYDTSNVPDGGGAWTGGDGGEGGG